MTLRCQIYQTIGLNEDEKYGQIVRLHCCIFIIIHFFRIPTLKWVWVIKLFVLESAETRRVLLQFGSILYAIFPTTLRVMLCKPLLSPIWKFSSICRFEVNDRSGGRDRPLARRAVSLSYFFSRRSNVFEGRIRVSSSISCYIGHSFLQLLPYFPASKSERNGELFIRLEKKTVGVGQAVLVEDESVGNGNQVY